MVKCPNCGSIENPPDNSFCEQCGYALTTGGPIAGQPCPKCGHTNPTDSDWCEKCGTKLSTQPKAEGRLVMPDGKGLSIPTGGKLAIGRVDLAKYASQAQIGWISRQHLFVFEENGVFFAQDDKSTNGTKLNGVEIKEKGKQQLKDADEILVGDAVKLLFRIE